MRSAEVFFVESKWNSNFNSPKNQGSSAPKFLWIHKKIQFHILLGFLCPPVLCRFPLNIRFTPFTSPFAFFSIQINSSNIFKHFFYILHQISVLIFHIFSIEFTLLFSWRFLEILAYQKIVKPRNVIIIKFFNFMTSLPESFEFYNIATRKFWASEHLYQKVLSFRTSLPESFWASEHLYQKVFELQNIATVYSMLFLNNKIIVWLFYITSIGFF